MGVVVDMRVSVLVAVKSGLAVLLGEQLENNKPIISITIKGLIRLVLFFGFIILSQFHLAFHKKII